MATRERRHPVAGGSRRASARLLVFEGALALALCALVAPWLPRPWPGPWAVVAGLGLAAGFLAVEDLDIKLDLGASSHATTLNELPFALGALTTDPRVVVVARLLASVAHGGLVRRQPPLKLVFNVLQHAATVAAGLGLVGVLGHGTRGPLGLAVLIGACCLLAAGSLLAVLTAIRLSTGTGALAELPGLLPAALLGATLCGLVGFFADWLASSAAWTVAPLVLLGGGMGLTYAGHVRLRERHNRLTTLTEFMTGLPAATAESTSVEALLARLRELFNAEQAGLLVLEDDGSFTDHVLDDEGQRSVTTTGAAANDWILGRALAGAAPMLLPRSSHDPATVAWLRRREVQDALVSPFPPETGLRGAVVVAGRRSTYGSFTVDDLRVLEGVTRHAAVSFQAGGLVRQLLHDSQHDALTGLPNRGTFRHHVDATLAAGGRAAVLLMDLDRFKEVNDTLGHQAGDLLLQEVARRLQDALPAPAVLARLGGDEFGVLLPGAAEASAAGVAEHLREVLSAPVVVDWLTTSVGASIGIAVAPEHGTGSSLLQRRADLAMYEAKRTTGVRIWSDALDDHGAERLAMLADLRRAVAAGQLEVHFQPQAAMNGDVVGLEALVRWPHPTRGWVSPEVFVPLAETSELLPAVTGFVLDRALQAARTLGLGGHSIGVAVNLSARDLLDDTLPARVSAALARYEVSPDLLTLEITENTVMEQRERCVATLRRLRALGVRLSVDDFGTGYSSLAYLRTLPVHEVKVDRSFVRELSVSAADQAIVAAVVQMARGLDLVVVAEGVEDAAAWNLLRGYGCDRIQGWHLARAMPLRDLQDWLRHWQTSNRLGIEMEQRPVTGHLTVVPPVPPEPRAQGGQG